MVLSEKTLTLLVLLSLGISALALLAAMASTSRRRGTQSPGSQDGQTKYVLDEQGDAIARLSAAVERLSADDRRLFELARGSLRHVGLVRYDAFEDMGGHLSFSAAILDAAGNGLVITSINGRADTRCYAKTVQGGQSGHNLSEEEEAAIRQALSGAPTSVPAS